jgi:NitT/TauT family transport system ATP-binding protein
VSTSHGALAVDPRILLLDEPFAALDAQTREIMQTELLSIWRKSRKTVLLITHQIDEAVFLSDRVIIFTGRRGSVRKEVSIGLPRPRDLEVKRTAEFVGLVDQIWKLIEEEVPAWSPGRPVASAATMGSSTLAAGRDCRLGAYDYPRSK